jgi:hypothetical protein
MDTEGVPPEEGDGAVQETVSEEQTLSKSEVEKLLKEAEEKGKREMQRIKDREVAEVRRRLQSSGDLSSITKDLDPEVAEKVELATLRARSQQMTQRELEEQSRARFEETIISFKENLSEYIKDEGMDSSDKRIDWGKDTDSLLIRQQKVLSSLAKIRKEDSKKSEEKIKAKIQETVTQERKEAGLDTVDTSGGSASVQLNSTQLKKMLDNPSDLLKPDSKGRKPIQELADKVFEEWKAGKFK